MRNLTLPSKVDFTESIRLKYGLNIADLKHIETIRQQSAQSKLPWFTSLGGCAQSRDEMRIPLTVPDDYGYQQLHLLLQAIKSGIPANNQENELCQFLDKAQLRLFNAKGVMLIDLRENRMESGMKVSKYMLKLIKKCEDATPFWKDIDFTGARRILKGLPCGYVTPEVLVQHLFQYAANSRVRAEISFVFDDFANGAETRYFGSCYAIGDMHERAPFTLGLSPNVAVVRLLNPENKLVGRSWLVLNKHGKSGSAMMFGSYNILGDNIHRSIVQQVSDMAGWKDVQYLNGVSTADSTAEDEVPSYVLYNELGIDVTEAFKVQVEGAEFEQRFITFDSVRAGVHTENPLRPTAVLEHFPCPVCGEHGPESRGQIVCRECAAHDGLDIVGIRFMSGSHRLAHLDAVLGRDAAPY